MDSEKEIALYYPYIDIKDAGLIKTAALYWDKLQTIVPLDPYGLYSERKEATSVTEFYKTDASREAKKEGFLEERIVNPMDESVQQTGRNFISDLREIPEIKESLANILRSKQWRHALADKYTTIYMEKFDPGHLLDLVFELKDAGVQFTSLTDGSNGIIAPKPFADMYMSRMASVIAQKDGSVPLTNESLWQDAALARVIDYSEERKRNQSFLAKMSLQTISIASETPLIEILRFKDIPKHREMLIAFRKYIRELARQVATGLDTTEKQRVFEEIIRDKVVPVKEEIQSKLSEGDIAFGLSAFDIAQATVMGAIASGGTDWRTGIAGAGISLTVSFYQSLREDRNIIKEHPLGYLYQAQKKFGAKK
jgi:hypothetical protein